eukprot:520139-Amphidinium_carterae.1
MSMVLRVHLSLSILPRSLLVLGNVMNALAKQSRHVPMRDSKLTRLLEEHLGGNCRIVHGKGVNLSIIMFRSCHRTALLLCVSPDREQVPETLTTLQFGSRAMNVKRAFLFQQLPHHDNEVVISAAPALQVDATTMLDEKRRDRKLEVIPRVPSAATACCGTLCKLCVCVQWKVLRQGQSPDVESSLLKIRRNSRLKTHVLWRTYVRSRVRGKAIADVAGGF